MRKGIERLVVEASALETSSGSVVTEHVTSQRFEVEVFVRDESADRTPLTPAQHLALSVLLGDEAVIPGHLADYCLDAGVEYATECYEKGKRDSLLLTGCSAPVQVTDGGGWPR